jgi:diguanylate cyclase (GGDEF)-like protein
MAELADALEPRAGAVREVALLFLDLDNFKKVNDDLGHSVGDAILHAVADRIRECLRAVDVAARLGGDEFGVLIREIGDHQQADAVADRILAAIGEPLTIGEDVVVPAGSIGIATTLPGTATADELVHDADAAMYRAKQLPAHRHRVVGRAIDFGPRPAVEAPGELGVRPGFEGA